MAPRKLFTIEKPAVDPKKSAKAKAAAKGKKGAVAAAGWCIAFRVACGVGCGPSLALGGRQMVMNAPPL